jgi:rhodanese-related sulfurtransferase
MATYHVSKKSEVDDILKDPSTFVLDVRTPLEFSGGALPRAVLIPIDQLGRRLTELPLEKETSILVYCAHGHRSLVGCKILADNGYTSVINLDGGLAHYGHQSAGR